MKKLLTTSCLSLLSLMALGQVQIDRQIQMTGAAAGDRRITGVSNAADVTPASTDAVNINTIQRNYLSYATSTFATGTYTVTLTPAITSYWEGMIVTFKASAANTGATNLNVNAQGAVAITKAGGAALAAGDIQANQIVTVVYNSTGPRFEIIGSLGIDGWKLRGNTGTNSANDYVGTTDGQALTFRTNNTARFRIANGNQVFALADGTAAAPFYSWEASTGLGLFRPAANVLGFSTSGAERMRILANGQVSINEFNNNLGTVALRVRNNSSNYAGHFSSNYDGILGESSSILDAFALWGVIAGSGGAGVVGRSGGGASSYMDNTGGSFSSATGTGVYGISNSTTGTGAIFVGNNTSISTLTNGSGIASNGTSIGVYGYATGPGNDRWGGYFVAATNSNAYAYVGGRTGGTNYKINGPGSVATMVKDLNGEYVNMFCPESPEVLFQDYGTGKLVNGRAYIQLDPIFAKNIYIDEAHPMKVFIQLEGDCKGVYVTNKSKNGFEVKELQGGTSNVTFSWTVVANRTNTYDENGNLESRFQDIRFPKSPKKLETIELKDKQKIGTK